MGNPYDQNDIVVQNSVLHAEGLKLAAYQVRDVETGELSKMQFHATYNNTIMAAMGESAAKLFCSFVEMTLNKQPAADH